MKGYLVVAFIYLVACIPNGMLAFVERVLRLLLSTFAAKSRFVMQKNLETCFPDQKPEQINHLIEERQKHLIRLGLETTKVWCGRSDPLYQRINSIEGADQIKQDLADKKGVLVISPHIGNWELLGCYLGREFKTTCMYQPPSMKAVDELIKNSRAACGIALAPTSTKGVKTLLKALKKGEVVGILPDQVPPEPGGEFVPFYGEPAYTITLIHSLLRRTGAKAYFAILIRDKQQGFKIQFFPADDAIYSDDLLVSLGSLNASVEHCVNLAPEQYQWEYKRFKHRPDGDMNFYTFK